MSIAAIVLIGAVTSSAPSESSELPPLVTVEGQYSNSQEKLVERLPLLGVRFDVGLPDGIGASLTASPLSFLRLHVGGASNGIGAGVRMGVALVPQRWLIRPTLGIDGGYSFGGVAAWLPQLLGDATISAVTSNVSIAYVSGNVGVEIGSRNLAFFLQAGASYLDVSAGGKTLSVGGANPISTGGIGLRGVIPSARLGFLISFG